MDAKRDGLSAAGHRTDPPRKRRNPHVAKEDVEVRGSKVRILLTVFHHHTEGYDSLTRKTNVRIGL
jgi:hypothetical protein